MDKGSIKMQGDTFEVIKAYEEYMYGSTRYLKNNLTVATQKNTYHSIVVNEDTLNLSYKKALTRSIKLPNEIFLNEPRFQPHAETPLFPIVCRNNQFDFISPGGISRWEAIFGLKVSGFTIVTEKGLTNKLVALRPAKIIISLVAEIKGSYNCRYCIAIDDYRGTEVVKIFSPIDDFVIKKSEHREIEIILNPIQIGPGDYTIGLSILDGTPLEQINNASRYDLLSRSFSVSVEVPDSLSILTGKFIHSAEWIFNPSIKPKVSNNYDKKEVNNQ